ncbi:O-antigen ligase family protein [Shewanella gelidimarina]|uniref:O-antigen ligase family protein n=1 Tax=Shewanella gelidimarina TaxID=56813 RepID=UPI00200FB263|nr:O-antigen ligase family protein [Shewanella gelidimarina]MCL1060057.1 O-antigen ligase family protein [Shewanella gelidimarina]
MIGLAFLYIFMQITGYPSVLYGSTTSVPFSTNIRYLGYLVTASTAVVMVSLLQTKIINHKLVGVSVLFTINLGLLVWLGGRGSLISLFSTTLIYISYLAFLGQLQKNRLILLLLLTLVSFYFAYICNIFDWNGPLSLIRSSTSPADDAGIDLNRLSSNRIAIWTQTLEAIKDKPWLGYGPEGYRFHPEHIFGLQPHNAILQLLIGYGLFGTLIIIHFYIKIIILAVKQVLDIKNKDIIESRLALTIIISLSIHSLVDGTFYHSQPLYLIIISIGALFVIESEGHSINKDGIK